MRHEYEKEAIAKLAAEIKAAGFRVFIAERGTYGFYTDEAGTRVVSFEVGLSGINYTGNYKSQHCGTGWQLRRQSFADMIDQLPPHWATKGEAVTRTTLEQHLKTYQASSKYVEVGT